jgi:hypothetical protein
MSQLRYFFEQARSGAIEKKQPPKLWSRSVEMTIVVQ